MTQSNQVALTEKSLITAIEKCLENAQDLIDDAILLKQNNRKERAYTLFQLGTEEVGKSIRIFLYLLFDNLSDTKAKSRFLKDFFDHKEKTKKSIAMDLQVLLIGRDFIKDKIKFLEASQYELASVDKINNLKNYSLYTSIHDNQFKTPKEIISEKDLENIEFRTLSRYAACKEYLQAQLPFLDELKKYMIANRIELSEDEIVKKFWAELE